MKKHRQWKKDNQKRHPKVLHRQILIIINIFVEISKKCSHSANMNVQDLAFKNLFRFLFSCQYLCRSKCTRYVYNMCTHLIMFIIFCEKIYQQKYWSSSVTYIGNFAVMYLHLPKINEVFFDSFMWRPPSLYQILYSCREYMYLRAEVCGFLHVYIISHLRARLYTWCSHVTMMYNSHKRINTSK